MSDQTSFIEEFTVTIIIVSPSVGWWEGYIGFETVVVVYLVLMSVLLAQGMNALVKRVEDRA